MIKIITTVGASLFCREDNSYRNVIKRSVGNIEKELANKYDRCSRDINHIKTKIRGKIEDDSSAEIQSTDLIIKRLGKHESYEIYLLATYTVISRLASEILKEYLQNKYREMNLKVNIFFNEENDVIADLHIFDSSDFKRGIVQFVKRFSNICQGYYKNVVLNITAGFKALIPFMTIMGQINQVSIYYAFEDTDRLIEIPRAPLSYNTEVFERFEEDFLSLEGGEIGKKSDFGHEFIDECNSCIEIEDNLVLLNPLGEILWNRYRSKFIFFYCDDKIYYKIKSKPDIIRILKSKNEYIISGQDVYKKNGHLVYDDGNNPNRIFLLRKGGIIYIYNVFDDHDKYEQFLTNSLSEDMKDEIIEKSTLRKMNVEEV